MKSRSRIMSENSSHILFNSCFAGSDYLWIKFICRHSAGKELTQHRRSYWAILCWLFIGLHLFINLCLRHKYDLFFHPPIRHYQKILIKWNLVHLSFYNIWQVTIKRSRDKEHIVFLRIITLTWTVLLKIENLLI